MVVFIIWKLEWMKILFILIFNKEIATPLLEYNYFDYCFQVLFVNVAVWILLWILMLPGPLNISLNIITILKYYGSQGLNEELKLTGGDTNFFLKKLLGHEIISPIILWTTKIFFENFEKPSAPLCKRYSGFCFL